MLFIPAFLHYNFDGQINFLLQYDLKTIQLDCYDAQKIISETYFCIQRLKSYQILKNNLFNLYNLRYMKIRRY